MLTPPRFRFGSVMKGIAAPHRSAVLLSRDAHLPQHTRGVARVPFPHQGPPTRIAENRILLQARRLLSRVVAALPAGKRQASQGDRRPMSDRGTPRAAPRSPNNLPLT